MSSDVEEIMQKERFLVKAEIVATIERICTGFWETCSFGYCGFNRECAKPLYKTDELPDRSKKLKSILKNAKSKERKKLGTTIHNTPKKATFSFEKVNEILGQDILEHDLIKDSKSAKKQVRAATDMGTLIKILQWRHNEVHGKYLNLPKGRYYYWKYKNE